MTEREDGKRLIGKSRGGKSNVHGVDGLPRIRQDEVLSRLVYAC